VFMFVYVWEREREREKEREERKRQKDRERERARERLSPSIHIHAYTFGVPAPSPPPWTPGRFCGHAPCPPVSRGPPSSVWVKRVVRPPLQVHAGLTLGSIPALRVCG